MTKNEPKYWCDRVSGKNTCRARHGVGTYHSCPELNPGQNGFVACNRDILIKEIQKADTTEKVREVLRQGLNRLKRPFKPGRFPLDETEQEKQKEERRQLRAEAAELRRIRKEDDELNDRNLRQRNEDRKRKRREEREENMPLSKVLTAMKKKRKS